MQCRIKKAIATAAAIGPFIAVMGSLGFVWIGIESKDLPPYSVGYINIAAFFAIVTTSIFCAPLGAKFAHALPVPKLKKYFVVFMLCISVKMLLEIWI